MKLLIRGLIAIGVIAIIWQLIILGFSLPPYILPSPLAVLASLWQFRELIFGHAIPTMVEALAGFLLGLLVGSFWALLLAYFRSLRLWFLPILLISQALPIFAIAPLLVVWFGYGMSSKIIVTCLMLFFPITSAFYDGLRNTPNHYLDLAQIMNATKWQILWRIRVPAALVPLGNGIRVTATFAPMGAVIGEWVGASKGLGFLILNANSRMQLDLMFAAILVLVGLTLTFYYLIDLTVKHFLET